MSTPIQRKFQKLFFFFLEARGDSSKRQDLVRKMLILREQFKIERERFLHWFRLTLQSYEERARELFCSPNLSLVIPQGTVH